MDEVSPERVARWAAGRDADSLLEIERHRTAISEAAHARPEQPDFALALARLAQLRGSTAELEACLADAANAAREPMARARLALARSVCAFEAGRLADAERHAREARACAQNADFLEPWLEATLALVRIGQLNERPEDSRRWLGEAADALSKAETPLPWLAATERFLAGEAALREGRISSCRDRIEHALRLAESYGGRLEASVIAGVLGNLEHDLGHLDAALGFYDVAISHARAVTSETTVAIFTGYRGWALFEAGRASRARATLKRAIDVCEALSLHRFAAQFRAQRAVIGVSARSYPARVVELTKALGALEASGDAQRALALAVLPAVLEASAAREVDDPRRRVTCLLRAAALIDEAVDHSDDARVARRVARSHLDAALRDGVGAAESAELRVAVDASRLSTGAAETDLRKHQARRRILAELLLGWAESRDVSSDALIAAAWPGERMAESSATHRLHVAISALRKAGLAGLLERQDGGYRLTVRRVALLAPAPVGDD